MGMVDREPLELPCHIWVIKCPVSEVEVPSTLTQWHRKRGWRAQGKVWGWNACLLEPYFPQATLGTPLSQAPSLSGTFVCFLDYGLHMLWCPHCLVQVSDSVEGFIKSPALSILFSLLSYSSWAITFHLTYLLALWPWANDIASLCLRFLLYKVSLIIEVCHRVIFKIKWSNSRKVTGTMHSLSKNSVNVSYHHSAPQSIGLLIYLPPGLWAS